jgi:predicted RNA-binding Zn ribbon-like protein
MDLSERASAKTKLVGGRLCLDFVNTVGGRRISGNAAKESHASVILTDKLRDYADLIAWSLHAGLLSAAEAQRLLRQSIRRESEAAAVLARAIGLREALYRIFRALLAGRRARAADVDLLNRELAQARRHEWLECEDTAFRFRLDSGGSFDSPLHAVAGSAAEFLTRGDLTRLRECGGEDCGWIFEDSSRNRSRQWCDMRDCGNLAKVRRFRAKLQGRRDDRRS